MAFVAPSSSWCQLQPRSALLVREITIPSSPSSSSAVTGTTALYGVNKRRGQLGNNVSFDDDGTVRLISNKQKQRRGSNSNNINSSKKTNKRGKSGGVGDNNDEVVISPLLAQWAATEKEDYPSSSTSSSITSFDDVISDNDAEVSYQILDGQSSTMTQQMDALLEEINDMLSTNNCNVPNLVANIVSLANLGSQTSSSSFKTNNRVLLPTLKALLSAKTTTRNNNKKQPQQQQPQQQEHRVASYRLAWAGSDEAICHIGTSLHKVPLARLQEIYLTLGGIGRKWELIEVIRILGPFPNVRNTLRGDVTKLTKLGDTTYTGMKRNESSSISSSSSSSGGSREGVRMEIAYNSMIDGTGKEILASGESRVKYVNLDVWFANEKALVCTTVTSENSGSDDTNKIIRNNDPLRSSVDGSGLLFFVAEDNLEEQLEKLRAA